VQNSAVAGGVSSPILEYKHSQILYSVSKVSSDLIRDKIASPVSANNHHRADGPPRRPDTFPDLVDDLLHTGLKYRLFDMPDLARKLDIVCNGGQGLENIEAPLPSAAVRQEGAVLPSGRFLQSGA
jgi:hypothetical protein